MEWIGKHTLLPRLKGKTCNYETLSERFDTLGEPFWNRAWELLPEQWRLDQFTVIKSHVDAICANRPAFINELKKLLS